MLGGRAGGTGGGRTPDLLLRAGPPGRVLVARLSTTALGPNEDNADAHQLAERCEGGQGRKDAPARVAAASAGELEPVSTSASSWASASGVTCSIACVISATSSGARSRKRRRREQLLLFLLQTQQRLQRWFHVASRHLTLRGIVMIMIWTLARARRSSGSHCSLLGNAPSSGLSATARAGASLSTHICRGSLFIGAESIRTAKASVLALQAL